MYKPQGIYVAMVTPFDEAGEVDEKALRNMVEFYVQAGVDGVFSAGSSGEFIHLGPRGCVEANRIVADQVRGRIEVLAGASASRPRDCVAIAQRAKEDGCQAAVICPPPYYRLSQDMIRYHYELIAEQVNFPLVLYNIPMFTNPISPEIIGKLSRLPNIVGLKDSSGSMVDFMAAIDAVQRNDGDLQFLTGREENLFASLIVGGAGCIGGGAAVVPEAMVAIYRAYQMGNHERLRCLQLSIVQLVRIMMSLPFPVGFKVGLELRGMPAGELQQPLSPEAEAEIEKVRPQIQALIREVLHTATCACGNRCA
ncbi:MAG: dihydrodipicolinate synthase family protein [Clostridia bacterium]|nr:dihydrodipicolinate synthase family protein [Clostridia bacterium]